MTAAERKAYHKRYRETHRAEFKIYAKKYYHSARGQEMRRKYLETHRWVAKEHYKIAKKRWHEANKQRRYAAYKIYRKHNLLRMRARDQRRIAREQGAKGLITVQTFQRVYADNINRYGLLTCYLCLTPVPKKKDVLEHKKPLSRGGTNYLSNLAIACRPCNSSKKDKTVKEYRKYALLFST